MGKYDKVVAWIPHCSTFIPNECMVSKEVLADNLVLSDVLVDKLFDYLPNKIVGELSRFVVDLERYADDDKEIMSKVGMGMLYTKCINGSQFSRSCFNDVDNKQYYFKKHNELKDSVNGIGDGCVLLDLHSFNDKPLQCDVNQDLNRPDVCIGFNDKLDDSIKNSIIEWCSMFNKSVKFNDPFSGAMTANTSVKHKSFMIEVNKRTYLTNNKLNADVYKTISWLKGIVDILVK